MAHIIKDLEPSGQGIKKYPWEDWQNGQAWHIECDEDIDVDAEKFRAQLYVRARASGMRVTTHLTYNGIDFQFFPRA